MSNTALAGALAGLLLAATGASANAEGNLPALYEVRVTNVTAGVFLTPTLVVTHSPRIRLFTLGSPASTELAALAESGNPGPLQATLESMGRDVGATAVADGLLQPGMTTSIMVHGRPGQDRLSLAAMLVPTNDGFYSLDSVQLPATGSVHYAAVAYDAGSEYNDELCVHIPGPQCGGEGLSAADGEGFVHVHPGTHGLADVNRANYDWRNPVAVVTVTRMR